MASQFVHVVPRIVGLKATQWYNVHAGRSPQLSCARPLCVRVLYFALGEQFPLVSLLPSMQLHHKLPIPYQCAQAYM